MSKALASTRNVQDADDLVQETFLRAWRRLPEFRDETRFGGWIFRILANLAADRGRKLGREVGGAEELAEATAAHDRGPLDRILAAELGEAVRRGLEELPPGRRREVFRMRFVEGLPLAEIANKLGVHTGTVKVHLFRVARELRQKLRDLEPQA
jgi:RNA polymerase sigma-70 factor (ECF subfamily)